MKTIRQILIIFFLAITFSSFSQEHPETSSGQVLMGKVVEKDAQGKESSLGMAGIKWLGTTINATSDEKGNFHIPFPDSLPAKLIVSMIGYKSDTIIFRDKFKKEIKIVLKNSATTLGEVKITGRQLSTSNLTTTTLNTELITQKELTLAACCNLSESFERNASVDVNFTDAVSGTRQIQMLGLDGIYTQILYENLPFVRGLSSSYGLTYIPGPWVENILVTKGTGSVVNGYESITGQIQIELLEPSKADRFFLNGYANNEQRYELNAHLAHRFNEKMGTLLFAHASQNQMSMDKNKDSFLDFPLKTQYNVFNRWHYIIKDKAEGQFGIRAVMEDRTGGQTSEHLEDTLNKNHYNININSKQIEAFTKNGFLFPNKPWKSIAITTTERYHKQDAVFGNKKYAGEQKSLYVNTIWADIIGHTFHKIKFGASLIADDYKEKFVDNSPWASKKDSIFDSKEIVPGGYAEYTFNNDTNLSIVYGLRADYFDDYGLMVNPRLHLKYNSSKESVFRLSGGRGLRTPHIFVENSSVFASSREIIIKEKLTPEIAWNYGMTFSYCFKPWGRDLTLNFDLFRTDFQNQVVVDLENPDKVEFYNLKGISYSNSFQTELSVSPFERFDIKLAYKFYDVKTTYNGKLLEKPLVPKDRALLNLDYETNMEKWKFNFTSKWFGKNRLPNTSANAPEFQLPEYSEPYFTFMGQITKKFKWIEVYLGGENLLDYRIPNPIIDPQNTFGNFDATIIWGPVNGRVIYGGFRYKIQ